MSYDIYIFHPDVKENASQGVDLDAFEHPPLSESAVQAFKENLLRYGYELEHQSEHSIRFVKRVGQYPIQVAVSKTEIAFSVPYGSEDAIFDALMDCAELCDQDHMVTFNPQDGEWGP